MEKAIKKARSTELLKKWFVKVGTGVRFLNVGQE
jgi:hypothetical protein